ncbi:CubicO group peptidase, beta-lactamase class C family [Micromonospora pattaloongensis]|uniref:CubicO group peptidase, beta-lactamase class C family n=1 Tax=Micromonospora pattaloongensis TaxID=405436 RepID=A0A1H3QEI2_9ACTN|nr:serine hydrolase domain-containing protein [Micromonospora pattaloongensis]SDZ11932.1 CubicO group peptidase, beta-lactamase class C family [Micromonospora pattaloongensis]
MSLLPETARLVDALVAEAQSVGQVPSLVLGVVRDGALAHFTGTGEQPRPDPGTQYRIGSISKTMTAALVLQLRDEGRLSLDDLLYRHLPGTPVGSVTLHQLLGHAGGLQREPEGEWWERSEGVDVDTLLAGLTPDKVAFPPHRSYHYSNLAYGLLGAVLERITGEEWATLLGKRLLDPLGLRRTSYHPVEPYARGYVVHPWHGTLREEPRTDTGAMAPAGQLWSTATDLATWAAFLADPTPSVLAPETITEMCAPVVISDLESWTHGHGLGLELYRVGERVYVGHNGSMPGYVASLAVHRPSRTAVIGYANAYGLRDGSLGALGLRALTAVLDREPARPQPWRPGTPPPEEIAPLLGRWWWMGREYQASWDAERDELVLTLTRPAGAAPQRFAKERADRWRGRSGANDGEILTVRRDAAGAPVALDIATFVFHRDPDSVA